MSSDSHRPAAAASTGEVDPVCGMTISREDAAGHTGNNGRTYYFCSESCLKQFQAEPRRFQHGSPPAAVTSADSTREYTCPMDPEVRQQGTVDGRQVAVGNTRLLESVSAEANGLAAKADVLRQDGQTVMFVAIDHRAVGLIGVADPVKAGAREAIGSLHAEGVRVVMLTGDNRTTADAVARTMGIDLVQAEVLPDQKATVVKDLQNKGERVAMAGDGINDAPALAQADVGIAMGTGTDVAIESAGITLVRGDLRGIVRARRLSRGTMSNIRQNLFFAFAYNVTGVPIAAGILYPWFGLLLSPIIASAAMTFSSVSVIGNALRLRRVDL